MTLIRAIGRTMLATYFVASGIKTARNPALFVEDAQPLADKIVPTVQKYAPRQLAGILPDDTVDLVRLSGIAQVAGGVMLASGKGRRLGASVLAASLVPSTLARHPYWTRQDPEQKAADKTHFFKNLSLLGGVIIASRDTEGQPGLRWRAATATHGISKGGKKASKSLTKSAGSLGKNAEHAADAAVAGGIAVVGGVLEQSRRARKKAQKSAKKAAKRAKPLSGRAQKKGEKLAAQAQKQAEQLAAKAQKSAKKGRKAAKAQAKELRKSAAGLTKDLSKSVDLDALKKNAQHTAKDVTKEISSRASDARKSAEKAVDKVTHNIELGAN